METISQFGGVALARHHSPEPLISARLKDQAAIDRKYELLSHARPSTAPRPARAPGFIFPALVAVSAIIFLAYLCSVSIVKKKTKLSFSRGLAARSGGEECNESDDSGSTSASAGTSPEGQLPSSMDLASHVEYLRAQTGSTGPPASRQTTTAAFGTAISRATTPTLGTQGRRAGHKRQLEEEPSLGKGTKVLRLDTTDEESQLDPSPPLLDPDFDAFIDSVLFGGAELLLSESLGLFDDAPLHPTGDSPIVTMSPALDGDPERQNTGKAAGNTMYELPPARPPGVLPNYSQTPEEKGDSGGPSFAGSPGSQTQRPPAGIGAPLRGPSLDATQAREEPPLTLTAEMLATLEEAVANFPDEQTTGTLASSSRSSPPSAHLTSGVTLSKEHDSAQQSASETAPSTVEHINPHLRWLERMYPGVPESVLLTHPFYRHPEYKPGLSVRPFSQTLATLHGTTQINANVVLAKCREIMKKPSLTPKDLKELMSLAERLCGYASERMPACVRNQQALRASETLGTIFLVLDALYCAAEVLGEKQIKEVWWPLIIRHIEGAKFVQRQKLAKTDKRVRNIEIAETLNVALESYRRGTRPSPLLVISLKEALFCGPSSWKFQDEQWDQWRKDVDEWRQSVQPSLEERK